MNTESPPTPDPLGVVRLTQRGFRIVKDQARRMATFFVVAMTIVVIGLTVCPRKYISESRLFVRVGRENIGLDTTATTGQTISLAESRENEITSILDILDSRAVLEGVVDELGPEVILEGAPVAPRQEEAAVSDLSEDEQLRREKAIKHLTETLEVSRSKKSNVIVLGYRDTTPQLAQHVLKSFVERFRTVHIRANRTSGSFDFLDGQVTLVRQQYEDATRELNNARGAFNTVSVEQRQEALETQLATVESNRLSVRAELIATEGTIRSLRNTLQTLPQKSTTQEVTGLPDDSVETTRKRLHELLLKEQQLLAKVTEFHHEVVATRRQIDAARTIFEGNTSGSQATNADNPAYRQLHLKLLDSEALAAGLVAKLEGLDNQIQTLSEKLNTLNGEEARMAELQQQANLFRDKYRTYSEKLEQARMDQALESEQISNVNVVQPPTFVAKPVSPQKAIVLVLGFLFSCFGAVCYGLLKEFMPALRETFDATAPGPVPGERPISAAGGDVVGTMAEMRDLVDQARK